MADPVTALIVVSTAATAAKGYSQYEASQSKMDALNLSREQHVLQHQQKTLANYETTQKILDAQTANATTRGVGMGSPSLEAIARNTINVSAKNQKNLNTEESIFEQNLKAEKSNVSNTLFAELFGDAASLASDFASVKAKMPSAA